jgi:hypothetical protein
MRKFCMMPLKIDKFNRIEKISVIMEFPAWRK